jgi:excisionase family DNA binding protein
MSSNSAMERDPAPPAGGESAPKAQAAAAGERLGSWKEIAVYLGCSVRTVQRWEREEGLPVRRLSIGRRSRIYAERVELEQWVGRKEARLKAAPLARYLVLAAIAACIALATVYLVYR